MNTEITSLDRILGYYFDQTNQDLKEEKEVIYVDEKDENVENGDIEKSG